MKAMLQSVGNAPLLASLASLDQRRPSEAEPDSSRITPATATETTAADKRRPDPSDIPPTPPKLTRVAFTAKFGPDADGFPLQLIRGEQVTQAESADLQAIVENRVPQNETRAALIQAQEARDDTANASRRQQEAIAARRADVQVAQVERQAAQDARQAETERSDSRQQTAGSFLDLQV